MRKFSCNVTVLTQQSQRISLKISSHYVDVFVIKGKIGKKKLDKEFLDTLRKKFPNVVVQAIHEKFVLNKEHLQKVLLVSFQSLFTNNILSNKLETDILLRFAGTTQISEAIKTAGLQSGKSFFLILTGNRKELKKINGYLEQNKVLEDEMFKRNNYPFLRKHFQITKTHLGALSNEGTFEDILVEKGATLF